MTNFIKATIACVVTGSVLSLASCSSILEVEPRSNASSATALTTAEGLDAALNGIYDRLQSTFLYGRDFLAVSEALSDDAQATNKSGRLNNESRNTPQSSFVNWNTSYYAINQANLVIDATRSATFLTDTTQRNRIMGRAYFLRALLYHDLMRAYAYDPGVEVAQYNRGGVPLVTTGVSDQAQITLPARSSIADVYKQIYSDLQTAIPMLSATNVASYGSRPGAQVLLSRVALYNKDYATAVTNATNAINNGGVSLLANSSYISGWRAPNHPESLLEIVFTTPENIGVNTSLQTTYTTLVRPGDRSTTGGFGDLVPSAAFLNDLEAEKSSTGAVLDIRRQLYELGTTGRGTAFVECTKFLGKNGIINLDNVPVIRISEAYLNRAEANAMLGNTTAALTDLNAIRTRAGLPASTLTDNTAILTEILRQRRLEYGFEGHRWFDLKRRGQDIIKVQGNVPYTDYRLLANIPTTELVTNPNIRQNFGY
jgi:hypothetical protein